MFFFILFEENFVRWVWVRLRILLNMFHACRGFCVPRNALRMWGCCVSPSPGGTRGRRSICSHSLTWCYLYFLLLIFLTSSMCTLFLNEAPEPTPVPWHPYSIPNGSPGVNGNTLLVFCADVLHSTSGTGARVGLPSCLPLETVNF